MVPIDLPDWIVSIDSHPNPSTLARPQTLSKPLIDQPKHRIPDRIQDPISDSANQRRQAGLTISRRSDFVIQDVVSTIIRLISHAMDAVNGSRSLIACAQGASRVKRRRAIARAPRVTTIRGASPKRS